MTLPTPDGSDLVISNATPIISLSLIGRLELLKKLYGKVLIPLAVETEILRGGKRAGARELEDSHYIQVLPLTDPGRADLLSDLDRGEAEVIALAQEKNAGLVLLDERLARRHAWRLKLKVTGTVGILLRAKAEGYVEQVRPCLWQLQKGGIRLNAGLISRALALAGEESEG